MKETIFKNRIESGKKLAKLLKKYHSQEAVVLGLPRGGVITAKEVAKELMLPLGLTIVRKIGAPFNPEYAIAVISESGEIMKNEEEIKNINPEWFKTEAEKELSEAKRRREKYWGNKKPLEIKNKIAIIVDDGVATGLTIFSAINEVKKQKPKKIVVAVPVCPKDTAIKIQQEVDELISILTPEYFAGAVGNYYKDFSQVEDEEAIEAINDPEKIFLYKTSAIEKKFNDNIIKENLFLKPKKYKIYSFPNREKQIILDDEVKGQNIIVLGSIAPPFKNFWETFLLAHTLKKEKTKKIIIIFPYFAYMRQEKGEKWKSLMTDFTAKIAKISGIDQIVTFDIHSKTDEEFFKIPIVSLSTAKIFAKKIKEIDFRVDTIVAPDKGAIERANRLRKELELDKKIIYFEKRRSEKEIISNVKDENIGKNILIVDDILDTGETLLNAVKKLKGLGGEKIIIAVTHGLFTGNLWKKLFNYGVEKILISDSIPQKDKYKNIEIISIIPLLDDYLKEVCH